MKQQRKELPIFLDVSGRRWRIMKWWLLVAAVVVSCGVTWAGQKVLNTTNYVTAVAVTNTSSPDSLAEKLSRTNVPVIGTGPLIRVVRVNGQATSDAYMVGPSKILSKQESVIVGDQPFAIERYGATPPGKHLVLTFDDGPDAVYTTRLLDVLSREHVPATFFAIGESLLRYPDISKRIVREGHGLGNHSFTHADFEVTPGPIADQEINLTGRVMRQITGHDSTFFRPPYIGDSDQSLRDSIKAILHAQKLGYTIALYDYDTNDWKLTKNSALPAMPPFDGQDHVLLLHDGGGKREGTVSYVKALITEAKKHGYSFVTMSALYPENASLFETANPTVADAVFVTTAQAVLIWPVKAMLILFTATVIFVFLGMGAYLVLAIIQNRRTAKDSILQTSAHRPSVAIIVPAYNEEKVLESCVVALLTSSYKKLKIYIVDDGSTDNTWKVAQKLARRHKQVRAIHQPNGGKAAALNRGIRRTQCRIIISIDADTVFLPDTVGRLVRHFADSSVGAVAGLVRVGNGSSILACCQALEYATSIGLERTAQALLGAIMVVPGACGAWRRKAIIDAGRYSSVTLAEDCDVTMAVHMAGYRVVQDNTAIALTEVPTTLRSFARQRFRWAFGNVQVYWKYQNILLSGRHGWLDSFVLPMAIISTVGPLVFLPLLGAIAVSNLISGQYLILVIFMAISFCFQLVRALVGLLLGRESLKYLWFVPVARILYGPLRIYLVYATVLKALQGVPVGWNKLTRAGIALEPITIPEQIIPAKT